MTEYIHILIPLLSGITFYITGFYIKKKPPKNKNAGYGYRTAGSMKSQERWDFAQKHSADKIQFWSVGLVLMSIPMYFSHWSENTKLWVAIGIVLLFLMIPVFQTESALEEKFGDK